jgi:hypothetical protein
MHPVSAGNPAKPQNDPQLLVELQGLKDDERTRLSETFSALMNDLRARIEYAESRRGALATVGGVLLAAGVAGLLQATQADWSYTPAQVGLLVLVIGLIITGMLVLWLWGRQTNWDYPYKSVSQTWKHFYRDALPGAGEPRVPWTARLTQDFRDKKQTQFTDVRTGFVERSLSLRDPSISLAQDLEQTYLLHWTELYKNQFLSSLRRVLVSGVLLSLVAALVAFVLAIPLAGDDDRPRSATSKTRSTASPSPTAINPASAGNTTTSTTTTRTVRRGNTTSTTTVTKTTK